MEKFEPWSYVRKVDVLITRPGLIIIIKTEDIKILLEKETNEIKHKQKVFEIIFEIIELRMAL